MLIVVLITIPTNPNPEEDHSDRVARNGGSQWKHDASDSLRGFELDLRAARA